MTPSTRLRRASTPFKAILLAFTSCLAVTACSSGSDPSSGAGAGAGATTLNVLAASSTRVLNDDLEEAAVKAGIDADLAFVNAGSSTLVQQLADGAPGDLLLTANQKTMDDATSRDTVEEPRVLATNSMVMVVPKDNPKGLTSIADLSDDTSFVVCDPQVPCGDITEKLMDANGIHVSPDSQEHQVADVLSRVTSGEADAGWVYSTDAAAAADEVDVIDIDHADEYRNDIVGAVAKDSSDKEQAEKLLDVLDHDFDDQWRKHGFAPEG